MQNVKASFRDPGTQVFVADGEIHRAIHADAAPHYQAFMAGGLYDRLAADGLIVAHDDVSSSFGKTVIRPQRIPFISYSYEWCFSALKEAALNTLAIQKSCLDHHMTLQDATAFNMQYLNGRWVCIDTGSFRIQAEPAPWGAYRQFCQHFLAPLLLMAYRDGRLLSLFERNLDGIPLDLAAKLLPLRAKTRMAVWLHIVMHARFALKDFEHAPSAQGSGRISAASAYGLIDQLKSLIHSLDLKRHETAWTSYEQTHTYDTQEFKTKEEFVLKTLRQIRCGSVWDLGANTGHFSRLVAQHAGIAPVAFEYDFMTAEAGYRKSLSVGSHRPLHLWMDMTNPSSGRGWAGEEWQSLAQRGPADMVLALALVHHLCLGANVPLPHVAAFFKTIARHIVIEFVPKDDPQSQRLLKSRRDIYENYTVEAFEAAMLAHFSLMERQTVSRTGRVLYAFKAKD